MCPTPFGLPLANCQTAVGRTMGPLGLTIWPCATFRFSIPITAAPTFMPRASPTTGYGDADSDAWLTVGEIQYFGTSPHTTRRMTRTPMEINNLQNIAREQIRPLPPHYRSRTSR